MPDIERRRADSLKVDTGRLVGYAAVFNSESRDLGGFIEVIRPGAFTRSLTESSDDILALYSHDVGAVLGRVGAGTLKLAEDERGLSYSIDLPATREAQDLKVLVERGDVSGASFGFRVVEEEWDFKHTPHRRELVDVELLEVTITAMAAYADTSVARRSFEQQRPVWNRKHLERYLAIERQGEGGSKTF